MVGADEFVEKVKETLLALGAEDVRVYVAALSGGADSVAMLLALCSLRRELGFSLRAVHVNHGLRGEASDADELFCRRLCERLEVPLTVCAVDVTSSREKHESTEQCARRLRYDCFGKALRECGGGARLATAHTLSDNAETVLLNLARGTGLKGLCGIPPVRGEIVRPLIHVTREEVEDYCAALGESYVTDLTNLSDDYSRNRIRHNVVPALREVNGSVLAAIDRATRLLREDSLYLESLAEQALAEAKRGGGYDAAKLSALPLPIKSRAVAMILKNGGIEPSQLRIDTAVSLLPKRSARFNPCKNRFFTIRKGVCFVEEAEQHWRSSSNSQSEEQT